MAAIIGPGGLIILPWTVRGDCFQRGTVHGMTVQVHSFQLRKFSFQNLNTICQSLFHISKFQSSTVHSKKIFPSRHS